MTARTCPIWDPELGEYFATIELDLTATNDLDALVSGVEFVLVAISTIIVRASYFMLLKLDSEAMTLGLDARQLVEGDSYGRRIEDQYTKQLLANYAMEALN